MSNQLRRLKAIAVVSVLLLVPAVPAAAQSQTAIDEIRQGPLLLMWDRGVEVARWQAAFNDWLQQYPQGIERIAVDGIYGPITRGSTIDFQSWADIVVDGIVGPQTRGAMVEALTDGDAPPDRDPAAGDEVLSPYIDTSPDTADSQSPMVSVTDVRLGQHQGYDRVVFDIGGTGLAGWDARYVDYPRAAGSGFPIEVQGDAVLEVSLHNIALPPDAPEGVEPYDGPERIHLHESGPVIEVVEGTVFEGTHTFYVGVSGEQPFQVRRFDSPQRVVLDVAS